jgi:rhodanese-related sulfurtransferase
MEVDREWEIDPKAVGEALARGDDVVILDVRHPREHQAAAIAGSTLIPLNELPARAATELPDQSRRIVVHCHHGVRSMNATAWLRQQGYTNVRSMAGGIDLWSLTVDPTVPRY